MVSANACLFEHPDGRACGAPPLKNGRFCYWHAPGKGEEAAEARRLGGLRRRREKTVARAYDITGLDSVDNIRRVLEIAVLDALGLENSIARTRVLIAVALAAARLLEAASFGSFSLEVAEET
jgi:hypothetical protein